MNPRPLALTLAALSLAACTESPHAPGADASTSDVTVDVPSSLDVPPLEDVPPAVDSGPPDRLRPPADIPRAATEEQRATQRQSCMFRPGQWAAETLGSEVPVGDQMPIDHVLVLMQENRSFDHYFRNLPRQGHTDVTGAPDGYTNPRANGTPVSFHHDTERCIDDVHHNWEATRRQINNGRMDGFVTSNDPMGDRALTYFDQTDIPFYYALANTFAIGDKYFCSVPGPTWPNRLYLMAGTSFGLANNTFVSSDTRSAPAPHLFRSLDDAGITWMDYAGGPRMLGFFPYFGVVRQETRAHYGTIADLERDLRMGTLPQVAMIEPNFLGAGGDRVDEHPPGIPMSGERFVEGIVRNLMASPLWRRTALFITYDEHGGFADHVPPPAACEPDDMTPRQGSTPIANARFNSYGPRVPFILVSPYARRRFVSHRTYDHTSILRFIEARFGLPALTRRDANAAIPTDMFDFQNPPFMTPPTLPAAGTVDAATRERCNRLYPSRNGLE